MVLPTTPDFNRLRLADAIVCRGSQGDKVVKKGQLSQFNWELLLSVFCQCTGVTVVDIED